MENALKVQFSSYKSLKVIIACDTHRTGNSSRLYFKVEVPKRRMILFDYLSLVYNLPKTVVAQTQIIISSILLESPMIQV